MPVKRYSPGTTLVTTAWEGKRWHGQTRQTVLHTSEFFLKQEPLLHGLSQSDTIPVKPGIHLASSEGTSVNAPSPSVKKHTCPWCDVFLRVGSVPPTGNSQPWRNTQLTCLICPGYAPSKNRTAGKHDAALHQQPPWTTLHSRYDNSTITMLHKFNLYIAAWQGPRWRSHNNTSLPLAI